MASRSFILGSNASFHNWQTQFVNVVNNYSAGWQLSASALAEWTWLTVGANSNKTCWEESWAILRSRSFTRG